MPRARLAAVALVSGAALAYELLLIRWLAIAQWYPFVSLVISLALLGYGVAGTLLSVARERARARTKWLFPMAMIAFAMSAPAALVVAQHTGFNGLEMVWAPGQVARLSALYGILSIPFCFAACALALAIVSDPQLAPSIYAADLAGAGSGSLVLVLGLLWLPTAVAVKIIAVTALLAAGLAWPGSRRSSLAIPALLVAVVALPGTMLAPPVNPFKQLAGMLNAQGARLIAEDHSPYGWLAVVENRYAPPRYAPGLSVNAPEGPPAQLAVTVDGDMIRPITARDRSGFLSFMLDAAPYAVLDTPRVLILGAGGGLSTLQALALGASSVTGVELNPEMIRLVAEDYADFAGHLYDDPRVTARAADPRGFVRATREQFDLIRLGTADSLAAAGAGLGAAAEAYGLTVEAFADYYTHLTDTGVIAVLRWAKVPPRDVLKLGATAIAALRQAGQVDPGRHLVVLRNWDTTLLLVRRQPWPRADLDRLRRFAEERAFDLSWMPDIKPEELNRYHRLDGPQIHDGFAALAGPDADAFIDAYKFDVRPTTDDRPFFHHFFKWRVLPELLRLREMGGGILLDSGYLVQIGGLAQALVLSVVLILLPLGVMPRSTAAGGRWRPAVYFACLGLAFLFVEIAWIQKLTQILGHPLLAAAAGITTFLVSAGIGSALAQRWVIRGLAARALRPVSVGIAAAAGVLLVLHPLLERSGSMVLPGVAVIPLALLMGMPFPLAMARLGHERPGDIPWAWGINGCASVVSALLAGLLAIHMGYTALIAFAVLLYALAAAVWPSSAEPERG